MQEYKKAKAKLAQIQEEKRKVPKKREEATASSISKGVKLDPKGIEYKHVDTTLKVLSIPWI
jgi:hypothetical protein